MLAIFCYGTLEFAEVMQAVTGRSFAGVPATLHGYARYLIKNADYPAVIAEAGAVTGGTLYDDIDADTLRRLDRYEDAIYVRREVIVRTSDGESVMAESYVVPPQRRWALSSKLWDKDQFARRHLKRFLANLK
jgi:gamma-glutamylcyclotransferase (GGCT)/AIG2-like uncharacterized protein YtfP